jgi:hypothetical protein
MLDTSAGFLWLKKLHNKNLFSSLWFLPSAVESRTSTSIYGLVVALKHDMFPPRLSIFYLLFPNARSPIMNVEQNLATLTPAVCEIDSVQPYPLSVKAAVESALVG